MMAQATPNSGFESWSYGTVGSTSFQTPDNWNTLNSITANFGVITCERESNPPDTYSGLASIKLTTKMVLTQVTNGIATTGTINTSTQSITGGIPYAGRPDSIVGYYKYTSVSGDNGFIEIQLLGSGGDTDTVGYARFKTPTTTVSNYVRFAKKITYKKTTPVVNSIWILSSSADAVTHYVNSVLRVDDLQLIGNSTNVAEKQKMELLVGPNPASKNIVVRNPMLNKAILNIYDVTGRKLITQSVSDSFTTIDISEYPIGLYIYSITDENKNVLKTDKIIIQK